MLLGDISLAACEIETMDVGACCAVPSLSISDQEQGAERDGGSRGSNYNVSFALGCGDECFELRGADSVHSLLQLSHARMVALRLDENAFADQHCV